MLARTSQILLVPACIVIFDFNTIASGEYRYMVGSVPLILIAAVAIYYRFVKGENLAAQEEKNPLEMARLADEPKKFSKKSARIHERRKNRGRA